MLLRVVSLLLLVLSLVTTGWAHAQTSQQAQQVFAEGKALFDEGKLEEALPKFREAVELTGSPNARLYVGRCLKDLNRLAEAYEALHLAMREASEKADSDPKYTRTRDAAAAMVAIIEPKIGKLVIALSGATGLVKVTLNGAPVAADKLGVFIAVEPGSQQVVATPDDGAALDKTVEVGAGQTTTVTMDLSKPSTDAPVDTPRDEGDEGGSAISGVQIGGIVVLTVGVAGMVMFGVAGSKVLDTEQTLDDACGGSNCPDDSYVETIDEGRRMQLLANIGLGVGIAGLLAGTAMIVFGGSDDDGDESEAASVRPQIELSPTRADFLLRF